MIIAYLLALVGVLVGAIWLVFSCAPLISVHDLTPGERRFVGLLSLVLLAASMVIAIAETVRS